MESYVNEFKELLVKAQKEYRKAHQKTPAAQVEDLMRRRGLGNSEAHTSSVLDETINDIDEKLSEMRYTVLRTPDITENERIELKKMFSVDESRELGGVVGEKPVELTGNSETDKKIVEGKLESYKVDAKHWKELAAKEEEGSSRRIAFRLAEEASELLADRLRLQTNQRVQSEEAVDTMDKAIENNDLTKLERFKKWAKENMLGASALAISVAGLITGIVVGARGAIKAGAQGLSRFAKSVAKVFKKLGPLFSAVGSLVSTVLSWSAKGIAWLANNLWMLVILVTFALYNEYRRRRSTRRAEGSQSRATN